MPQTTRVKILRLHTAESHRHDGKPLYEAIVAKCREMGIAGATVFRGLEGYGETAGIHRRHLVAHDQPVIVVVVDSPENIERLKPAVEAMMDTGVIAVSDANAVRVQKARL
jgi:uncharacterized protein